MKEKKSLAQTVVENWMTVFETPQTTKFIRMVPKKQGFLCYGNSQGEWNDKMPFNQIAAVRWIDNRIVSLITCFEDKRGFKKRKKNERLKAGSRFAVCCFV
ncbi:hypothetical protein AVEN_209859-1 [Araneus ventricosus]|uniref:PiggyBac transposable element-derived protein domain-containing protein n=1 Tax=Araneus ventricosus TaxID=182803 RepID=A0A4Y2ISQ8_ARAVE|nr:hypothetical protein AVEN_209859-1 [Araneus ventricosus]